MMCVVLFYLTLTCQTDKDPTKVSKFGHMYLVEIMKLNYLLSALLPNHCKEHICLKTD